MDLFEQEIFVKFENFDLNNMRNVSKEFLKSINGKSELLYKSEDFEMKNSWFSIIHEQTRIDQKEEQIQSQISETKNNLQSINDKIKLQVDKFEMEKFSWIRLFVNILNQKIFILLKIKYLFCLLFPCINLECKKQISFLNSTKHLQNVKKIIELKLDLYCNSNDINNFKNEYLKNERFKLQKKYRAFKKYLIPIDLMKDLFGGRKAFENLPLWSNGSDYKKIKPEEMSAPFMRGDFERRQFFVIRVEEFFDKITSEEERKIFKDHPSILKNDFNRTNTFCQVFFSKSSIQQLSLNTFNEHSVCVFDQSWHSHPSGYGDILPPTEGSLRDRIIINEDGIVQDLLYNSLKKFIREKGNSRLRIC